MKATALGWYGHGNIGDESYKMTMPAFFNQDLIFTDKINNADCYILGGGHVVVDHFLKMLKDKPNKHILSATVTEEVSVPLLQNFKSITVRDVRSRQILADRGVSCNLMPDLAFLLQPDANNGETFIQNYFAERKLELYEKKIVVVLNAHLMSSYDKNLARDFVIFHHVVNSLVRIIDNTNASFIFVPFGQKEPYDDRVTNGWLASRCKFWRKNAMVWMDMTPQLVLDVIAAADALISTRLHASIFGCLGNTPFVDITHHDKNLGFMETINCLDWSVPYWQFNETRCGQLLNTFLSDGSQDKLQAVSQAQIEKIKEVAHVYRL